MTEQRTKVVMHDQLAKPGYDLPSEYQNSPPLVTWRCSICKSKILRLLLSPAGWYLHAQNYRISLSEWLERSSSDPAGDLQKYRNKELIAIGAREVEGLQETLPLDLTAWPRGSRFYGGCKCGEQTFSLDELRADADTARATRRAVHSSKQPRLLT